MYNVYMLYSDCDDCIVVVTVCCHGNCNYGLISFWFIKKTNKILMSNNLTIFYV